MFAAVTGLSATPQTQDRFANDIERRGFFAALKEKDADYDEKEQMIRRPFSSPGYHTTLKGGWVHPTRESLSYAVALLDSGESERLARAEAILRRLIALQDQNPESKTYGIWSWFLEEPLDKMSPPDWNWADFCGTQLLQVARDHMQRLPQDLRAKVKESIVHASNSIKRRNVGPGYTNIAIMGTYVTLVAGEMFDIPDLADYGKQRLKRFYDYTLEQGSLSEYNSPTYTIVAITEITRMRQHVGDPESQRTIGELNRLAWRHVARHFHAPTRQWAGPHSRCYSTMLGQKTLAFIQRATGSKAHFISDLEAARSLDACRLRAKCPEDLVHYFIALPEARQERETFTKGGGSRPDTIGTTWLHPDYALASVNLCDMWNQRRPLIAYYKTADGVGALRLRCLHDGYDYASGAFFSVQDKWRILGGLAFATDGGDTHGSLDRVKNATIRAKDLRVRLELEGDISNVSLPQSLDLKRPIRLDLGRVAAELRIARAVFGDFPIAVESGRDSDSAWVDVVLYHGEPRELNFREIEKAAVAFHIVMLPATQVPKDGYLTSELRDMEREGKWTMFLGPVKGPDMELTVPVKPATFGELRSAASANLAGANAWK
jgi:hypothetical protein